MKVPFTLTRNEISFTLFALASIMAQGTKGKESNLIYRLHAASVPSHRRRLQAEQFDATFKVPDGQLRPDQVRDIILPGSVLSETNLTSLTDSWNTYNTATVQFRNLTLDEYWRDDFDQLFSDFNSEVDAPFRDELQRFVNPELQTVGFSIDPNGPSGMEIRTDANHDQIQRIYEASVDALSPDQMRSMWSPLSLNGRTGAKLNWDAFKGAIEGELRSSPAFIASRNHPVLGGATFTDTVGLPPGVSDRSPRLPHWGNEMFFWSRKQYMAEKTFEEYIRRIGPDAGDRAFDENPLSDEILYVIRGPMRRDDFLFQTDMADAWANATTYNTGNHSHTRTINQLLPIFNTNEAENWQNPLVFSFAEMQSIRKVARGNGISRFQDMIDGNPEASRLAQNPFEFEPPTTPLPDVAPDVQVVYVPDANPHLIPSLFWVYFAIAMMVTTLACCMLDCISKQPYFREVKRVAEFDKPDTGSVAASGAAAGSGSGGV